MIALGNDALKGNKTITFDIKILENNSVLLRKFNTGIPANINYQRFINQNHIKRDFSLSL